MVSFLMDIQKYESSYSLTNSGIKLTHITQIDVADDEILKRLTGRRVHLHLEEPITFILTAKSRFR